MTRRLWSFKDTIRLRKDTILTNAEYSNVDKKAFQSSQRKKKWYKKGDLQIKAIKNCKCEEVGIAMNKQESQKVVYEVKENDKKRQDLVEAKVK